MRYSITRDVPSEHSPVDDVHGIDYMNITCKIPDYVMAKVEKLDIHICRGAMGMLEFVMYVETVSLVNIPIEHDDKVFYPTSMNKTFHEEGNYYTVSIAGYIGAEQLMAKVDKYAIKPDVMFENDDGSPDELRYYFPTNAKWVSKYGVEPDEKEEVA